MKHCTFFVFIACLLSFGHAQTYVELILDLSGSMYEKLDSGQAKIDTARRVLSDFITGLPSDNLNVGLRFYGANTLKLDTAACTDSELVVGLNGLDKAAILDVLQAAIPKGATPIAYSLEQALADFQGLPPEAKKIIIVVTDGEESCGGDLNAALGMFESQGITLELRIVGLGLSDEAARSFADVGATFENALDTTGFETALSNAAEPVLVQAEPTVQPTEPPEEPAPPAVQPIQNGLLIATDEAPVLTGVGETLQLYVEQGGSRVPPSEIEWTNDDPNIITVNADGIVTANTTLGSATITATYQGISGSIVLAIADLQEGVHLLADRDILNPEESGVAILTAAVAANVNVGDVLVSSTEGRLFSKVESKTDVPNGVQVALRPAKLAEAFESLNLKGSPQLAPSGMQTQSILTGGCKWDVDHVDIDYKQGDIDGGLGASTPPTLIFDAHEGEVELFEISVTARPYLRGDLGTLEVKAGAELDASCRLPLASISVPFTIGAFAITLPITLTFDPGITLKGMYPAMEVNLGSIDLEADVSAWMRYDPQNGFYADADFDVTKESLTEPSLEADIKQFGLEFEARLGMGLDVGLGARVLAGFSVEANIFHLSGGLYRTIGIKEPFDRFDPVYEGPTTELGLYYSGDLNGLRDDLGVFKEALEYIGFANKAAGSLSLIDFGLFDEREPLAKSERPQLTATLTDEGFVEFDVSLNPCDRCFQGKSLEIWMLGENNPAELVLTAPFDSGKAGGEWTPSAGLAGETSFVAQVDFAIIPFAGKLPYASTPANIGLNDRGIEVNPATLVLEGAVGSEATTTLTLTKRDVAVSFSARNTDFYFTPESGILTAENPSVELSISTSCAIVGETTGSLEIEVFYNDQPVFQKIPYDLRCKNNEPEPSTSPLQIVVWDGGGTSNRFDDWYNWNPDTVPDQNSHVIINENVVLDIGDGHEIGSLEARGDFAIEHGVLSIKVNAQFDGKLTMSSSDQFRNSGIGIKGQSTFNGAIELLGEFASLGVAGTVTLDVPLLCENGKIGSDLGSATVVINSPVTLRGQGCSFGASVIQNTDLTATKQVNASHWKVSPGVTLAFEGEGNFTGSLVNEGIILKVDSLAETIIMGSPLENRGEIRSLAGNLILNGSQHLYTAEPGQPMHHKGGTLSTASGATVTLEGWHDLTGVILPADSSLVIKGQGDISGEVSLLGTVTVVDSYLFIDGDTTITGPFNFVSGSLSGEATLTLTGPFNLTGGTLQIARTVVLGGATIGNPLEITGGGGLMDGILDLRSNTILVAPILGLGLGSGMLTEGQQSILNLPEPLANMTPILSVGAGATLDLQADEMLEQYGKEFGDAVANQMAGMLPFMMGITVENAGTITSTGSNVATLQVCYKDLGGVVTGSVRVMNLPYCINE